MTIERKGLGDGIREVTLHSGEIRYEARINRSGEKALQKRFAKKPEALRWRALTMDCCRRSNIDHLCRLNFDQGLEPALMSAGCG
jgi:hypothetical protein